MNFYSIHFNRPDFIEIQKKCIDSLCGNLVVIKNSENTNITKECERLGIKMYEHLNIDTSPSYSHGRALNFLKNIIDYTEDWCIIDHDFFPLKKINFMDYEILGLIQEREENSSYLWPGFMAGKKHVRLDEIDFLPTLNKDTGAGTSILLQGKFKIKKLSEKYLGLKEGNKLPLQTQKIIVNFEDFGIHYLNGSGWMKADHNIISEKNSFLVETIESLSPIRIN